MQNDIPSYEIESTTVVSFCNDSFRILQNLTREEEKY